MNNLFFMMDSDSQVAGNPVILETFDILAQQGFHIEFGIPEEIVTQPELLRVKHDLYILKSNTELSLSLAGILHTLGARIINPYLSCAAVQDKIVTSRLLRGAGIPVPDSWVTGNLSLLWRVIETTPLVIKPHRGHRGAGVRLIQNAQELAALPQVQSPVLIQEFVEGDGNDLKVYVVGEEVFGVRKVSPGLSFFPQKERRSQSGRPCELSPEVRDIGVRCGRVLGLGVYGLDVLETADGPKVVDVNAFPSYRGVSDVAPLIASYIAGYAAGEIDLRPPGFVSVEDASTGPLPSLN